MYNLFFRNAFEGFVSIVGKTANLNVTGVVCPCELGTLNKLVNAPVDSSDEDSDEADELFESCKCRIEYILLINSSSSLHCPGDI